MINYFKLLLLVKYFLKHLLSTKQTNPKYVYKVTQKTIIYSQRQGLMCIRHDQTLWMIYLTFDAMSCPILIRSIQYNSTKFLIRKKRGVQRLLVSRWTMRSIARELSLVNRRFTARWNWSYNNNVYRVIYCC